MADAGKIRFVTELDTKQFDAQITQLEAELESLETSYNRALQFGAKAEDKPMRQLAIDIEKTRNKLVELNKQKAKLEQPSSTGLFGSSFSNAIKQAGKLTLAIFGIRSAYLAVRRASSELGTYDKQYAANLEYIRYVLTQAIAPILRYIVNLAGTLLSYIYYILNAWFGISKFINVGAKGFSKMKAGAGGTAKAVKEIKKQLAGFDELNVLQDNQSDSASGGGGGVSAPDFDVSKIQGDVPKWLKWIADHKKLILGILGFIASALLIAKLTEALMGIKAIADGCHILVTWLSNLVGGLTIIKALGIGVLIYGVVSAVKDLIKFIKNPSWGRFYDILMDIAIVLGGLALITGNVGFAIAGLVVAIVGVVGKLMDEKTETRELIEAKKNLKKAQEELTEAEDEYINAVDRADEAHQRLKEAEERNKISGEELYASVQNGTLTYEQMTEAQREVYKAYRENEQANKDLQVASDNLTTAKNTEKKASEDLEYQTLLEARSFEGYKEKVVDAFEKGELSADEARDKIEQAMGKMSKASDQTFTKDLPSDIKNGLNPDRYRTSANSLIGFFQELGRRIRGELEFYVNANFSVSGGYGGGGGGGGRRAKGGVFYPSLLPRLASGGIISMPGKGALYNGAYIGERGAEAVVPLTDTQQMELLGATIGKYITINANIVNKMNGRTISRELKQIQNNQDFAYNM